MSSPQDVAEVILIVIKRLFKWLLLGIDCIFVLSGVTIGVWQGYEYYYVSLPESKIELSASPAPGVCPKEFPILVTITNQSSKTLNKVSFVFSAKLPNRSSNHASYKYYSSDKITKPGDSHGACYGPLLSTTTPKYKRVKDFDWSISSYNVVFAE